MLAISTAIIFRDVHSIPHTQCPTPNTNTLHPIPYTQYPITHTQYPIPHTPYPLHPNPCSTRIITYKGPANVGYFDRHNIPGCTEATICLQNVLEIYPQLRQQRLQEQWLAKHEQYELEFHFLLLIKALIPNPKSLFQCFSTFCLLKSDHNCQSHSKFVLFRQTPNWLRHRLGIK
jgi:hypothetical protein